ncbi:sensor histidine kinase [Actinomadura algeriensis]|uniref:histidine kinase n=1 Tax=Actinomadura algeriensis TaxID=1679523 RepID=A0ABR9JUL2_9ACTN|nr:HAMP domain-containing sensor histidine kinase [Actinomadura algeriensis]MBE1534093.1 signal transduction histidine kinase [Actinomadura algeriensis]
MIHRVWRLVVHHPEIRVRVTLSAVLAMLLLATVAYALLLVAMRRNVTADVYGELDSDARRVTTIVRSGVLDERHGRIFVSGDELLQVVDSRGRVIGTSPGMRGRPPVAFPHPVNDDRRDGRSCDIDAPGGECFLIVEYRVDVPRPVYVYALGPEPGLVPRPLAATLLGLGVPFLAALAGYGTWVAAGRTLRPVDAIRRELDEITATDLQRRVPVPGKRDEVALLAESVNATLDRLEKAVARQRGFVSDVSHELRSPLTGLRMELELALADPEGTDLTRTLRALLANTDRVAAVADDLLALARLEADGDFQREPMDLAELTDQEVLRRPRVHRVTVFAEGPVSVHGGRGELERVLTNLLDNADRHAAGEVTVVVRGEADAAVLEVVDDGPGIAPQDRERVFERFTRLADGRHRDAGGTGLGLSISRDIAEAHGGTLMLTDRTDGRAGARFVLRLPRPSGG